MRVTRGERCSGQPMPKVSTIQPNTSPLSKSLISKSSLRRVSLTRHCARKGFTFNPNDHRRSSGVWTLHHYAFYRLSHIFSLSFSPSELRAFLSMPSLRTIVLHDTSSQDKLSTFAFQDRPYLCLSSSPAILVDEWQH